MSFVNEHLKVAASRAVFLRKAIAASVDNTETLKDALVNVVRHNRHERPLVDGIVMCGPSGVGKGTIIARLMKERPDDFSFCVSHTSRQPRQGEVNGINYHFAPKEEMMEMSQSNEFLECCEVHGNMYGTSVKALRDVQASGKMPIIEIDVQGAQKLKNGKHGLKLAYLFIEAPSMVELEARIVGRGQESPDKVKVRLNTALKEMEFVNANRSFFDSVITNVDLDRSILEIQRFFAITCGI